MGPPRVVITGIPLAGGKIANVAFDRDRGQSWEFTQDLIPAGYPGTGDIFASVLLGALLQQSPLPEAVRRAGDFVSAAVRDTFAAGTPAREGVLLENALPGLCRRQPSAGPREE
jgi:pyridoxine kinase